MITKEFYLEKLENPKIMLVMQARMLQPIKIHMVPNRNTVIRK